MKSLLTYIFLFLFKGRKIAQYYLQTGKIFTKRRDEKLEESVYISDNIFIHGDDVELKRVEFRNEALVHISHRCYIEDTTIGGNTHITGSRIIDCELYNASIE